MSIYGLEYRRLSAHTYSGRWYFTGTGLAGGGCMGEVAPVRYTVLCTVHSHSVDETCYYVFIFILSLTGYLRSMDVCLL